MSGLCDDAGYGIYDVPKKRRTSETAVPYLVKAKCACLHFIPAVKNFDRSFAFPVATSILHSCVKAHSAIIVLLPSLFVRFICHRQRSQTLPLKNELVTLDFVLVLWERTGAKMQGMAFMTYRKKHGTLQAPSPTNGLFM